MHYVGITQPFTGCYVIVARDFSHLLHILKLKYPEIHVIDRDEAGNQLITNDPTSTLVDAEISWHSEIDFS